ncbi:TolC family protein [Kosakonia oryziphila]|uniref:Protein CyaE n=1 Tax=Kosakonia oryziphila TaxID=1005667 RepID=A0A1C4AR30_9ENTR|nr:TolC family protein [Kosakonia oryziphila]SCB97034.1 Outer membrane protein TolC [Kosakonia oryziphila]
MKISRWGKGLRIIQKGGVVTFAMLMSACATDSLSLAPPSPSASWDQVTPTRSALNLSDALAGGEHTLEQMPIPVFNPQHAYELAELIDIAEKLNPDTRIAWEQSKQAALAAGITEATLLPLLSATVVGGYQRTRSPLPYSIAGYHDLDTTDSAVIPAIGLQWLLFDFGQRSALVKAAQENTYAINASFNGTHQKIIFNVTRAYYMYGAALIRTRNTAEMMKNSQQILNAAEERNKNGIATIIEVSQAKQLVAQSKLNHVMAQGQERDRWQDLLGATGISPFADIKVAYDDKTPLPARLSPPTETAIKLALSRRPDIQAGYAAVEAARSTVKATEVDFLPKIYLAGVIAGGHGRFDTEGLPAATPHTSSSGIVLGVSMPLYDGGIRAARVQEAESRFNVARDGLQKTQDIALREIVVASDTLRSALESNDASIHLVKTASVTFDAASDAYRNGIGTITQAFEAANGLLDARQISADARSAAFIAAANLAFTMGEITRSQ